MCRAATRFPSKEPRIGHHGKLSSHLASQRASMAITCLILTGISHWLLWLHYPALFSLLLPHKFPFQAILSRLPWIQFRSFPSMPSNRNEENTCPLATGIWVVSLFAADSHFLLLERLRSVAMVSGGVTSDQLSLNLDSFWSGGPFQNNVSCMSSFRVYPHWVVRAIWGQ